MEMVIYKHGAMSIQTTVKNGYCTFSGVHRENGQDFTVKEYLDYLGPKYSCISFDNALDKIKEIEENVLIGPWEEIAKDQWLWWLEMLPPEKWKTVNGVNLFRLTEYYKGTITRHCAKVGNRCFIALIRITDSYQKLAKEITTIVNIT